MISEGSKTDDLFERWIILFEELAGWSELAG